MANRRFRQFFESLYGRPTYLSCNFVIDSTNGNGFGVRSLKGPGISRVYMNTSASLTGTVATTSAQISSISGGTSSLTVGMPVQGTGIPAGTTITSIIDSGTVSISATPTGNHASESITYQAAGSPNPAAGIIMVQLSDNYNEYIAGFSGQVSPVSTPQTTTTANTAYVIVVLGTATLAQWQAVGLPAGIVPAVGVAFVATATGTIGGSAEVSPSVATGSGIDHIEVLGNANLTINSNSATILGTGSGAYLILQCFFEGAITAPANGSVIGLSFVFNNTSIQGV